MLKPSMLLEKLRFSTRKPLDLARSTFSISAPSLSVSIYSVARHLYKFIYLLLGHITYIAYCSGAAVHVRRQRLQELHP